MWTLALDDTRVMDHLPLLEGDLLGAPGVRQDRIGNLGVHRLQEEGLGVDETHGDGTLRRFRRVLGQKESVWGLRRCCHGRELPG